MMREQSNKMAQFLSPVVHPKNRVLNATPAKDGYGHESFMLDYRSSGAVVVCTPNVNRKGHQPPEATPPAAATAAGEVLLIARRVVPLLSKNISCDELAETDKIQRGDVVTFASSEECCDDFVVSAEVAAVLQRRGVAAVLSTSWLTISAPGKENSGSFLPLVLGLEELPLPNSVVSVLPLHFDAFTPSHGLCCVFSHPVSSTESRLQFVMDCTQKLVPSSPLFPGPGAQLPVAVPRRQRRGCPAAAAAAARQQKMQQHVDGDEEDEDAENVPPVMHFSEDCGTHVDSARHFYDDLRSIDEYAANELALLPAVIIDISRKCEQNPDSTLDVEDILAWEAQSGQKVPPRSLVVMSSGWSEKFSCAKDYIGSTKGQEEDGGGEMHFPGFGKEAAEFLVKERASFCGLGVDTLSVDAGSNVDFEVHQIILKQNKYFHIENLRLPCPSISPKMQRGMFFLVGPLRVRRAFEAPARVVLVKQLIEED